MIYWTGYWVTGIKWKLGIRTKAIKPQGACEDSESILLEEPIDEELKPLELEEE
jgi:hypothetical protein